MSTHFTTSTHSLKFAHSRKFPLITDSPSITIFNVGWVGTLNSDVLMLDSPVTCSCELTTLETVMKRMALFALAAVLTIGIGTVAEAGLFSGLFDHGKSSCCKTKPSCCRPVVKCCAPAPTCCKPRPTCCSPRPSCATPGKVAPDVPYEETPPIPKTEDKPPVPEKKKA